MLIIDDLLAAPDFKKAVQDLAADFRARHGLGAVHQLGLVTPSAEDAAALIEKTGLGPFFIASGPVAMWRERGIERSFSGKMGLAYKDGIELELLEAGVGSDFYRRSMDPEGGTVVQHLGLLVDDVDREGDRLAHAGFPYHVRGKIKTGPMVTDFAYMDTEGEAGLVIEFISWRVFGKLIEPPPGLIHLLGKIEKMTGKRSLNI